MKRSLAFASLLLAAAVGTSSVRAVYRIDLRDGSHVLSRDSPVHRGSVVVFHLYPQGTLTSLPEEQVAHIRTEAEDNRIRGLRPGEVVDVGLTAGRPGASAPAPAAAAAVPTPIPGGVYDPRNPYYGYGGTYVPPGMIPPGDLARAVTAEPPTAENPIATPPMIGPNGTPVLGTPATPMIGPNGTPILAPPGGPGFVPPAIGPNGMPVLAPPGAPGSTPAPVGSNGYPSR